MTYDCFSFFNELDILEIRLNTLNEVVDKFVLVEATWTHTGKPKPLHFEDNKTRFAPFLDKITHIVLTDADLPDFPEGTTEREQSWIRENVQRNAITRGLVGAKPEDIILISDLDEIPNPAVLRNRPPAPTDIIGIQARNYAFFLNFRNIATPIWKRGTKLLRFDTFTDSKTYGKAKFSEYAPPCVNAVPSATLIRFLRNTAVVKDGGWHFSFQGGMETIKRKIDAYPHLECTQAERRQTTYIERCIKDGIDLFGLGERYLAEPIGETFPAYIVENQAKFNAMILPTTKEEWAGKRFFRVSWLLRKKAHDLLILTLIILIPRKLHPVCARIRKAIEL